ncbi:MAG: TIGR02678 family protein [Burkholderiales bacterium]|nr:TIGR02678 family protein [Burkholderiales bacterium]MDE1926825.1 TIGR02678 family protein [Burkholderiales bacterium]MDE2158058.1 TIGR02678 family protein [Burkholderiales bacterium]MDE2503413.1 TIGR02678 family protein [Burkholderiales bacterium]
MTPLMGRGHEALPAVRRQAEPLRAWFQRETGWPLVVERDGARLYKRPADTLDATRGLPGFDRRRCVLLCLACAVLERAEAQISLHQLGERLLREAAAPELKARRFRFALDSPTERRELVAVCKALMGLGVLERVAGDEQGYVATQGQGDALYDVRRRALASLLAAARGPSTWPAEAAPVSLAERLAALTAEPGVDSEDGRRHALRHGLARRLLDDPVLYLEDLDAAERAYFMNQRGVMAARLAEATGLAVEHRAEGSALTDTDALLSDIALPDEGTEAHATLLVAGWLAARLRGGQPHSAVAEVAAFIAAMRERHGRYWRKSAREAGGEHELAAIALARLAELALLQRDGDAVLARPALARYAVEGAE